MKIFRLLLILIISISLYAQNYPPKYSAVLKDRVSRISDEGTVLVWIFFKDKGNSLNKYFDKPSMVVSEASLRRRAKVFNNSELIDQTDLPVNKNYLNEIEILGVKVKNISKWFNGVSAFVAKKNLDKITSLDFVNKIDLVGMFKKSARPVINDNIIQPGINLNKQNVHTYDYGQSFNQVNLSKIPDVHDLGFTGKGITICVMDAGVSNLSHEVFADMITNGRLKAQYDFVNHDSVVANQADSGEGSHGTYTLALIGGFKQGQLIGPAFEANYLLAKTENTQSESPVEEDNWIAAMEWADSIGVDVTSTSLGYRDGFDFGYTDYTAQDMNGNTTRITIAAGLAVKKGVVVVNSAGNEAGILEPSTTATDGAHNTLIAPADGDSVITVGAVNTSGTKASFSSYGPTFDGRIKPDVMAVGVNNYIPDAT